MVLWSAHLQSAFPEVVTKIRSGPVPNLQHSFIYHELSKSEIPIRHPTSTAELVLYLLSAASVPFYDIDAVVDVVRRLALSDIDRLALRQICDELARLGYYGAQALKDSVDAGGEK